MCYKVKMKRAIALDAFRGYAIVTMILSGTIASGVLPAWMYHAQVGPRSGNVFDPTIYGITWVDLVFPFFLFAMGAAFPFSIGNKIDKGENTLQVIWECLLRGMRLTFFAIFIQHMYPWVTSSPQDATAWMLSVGAFLLMFPMFMRIPLKMFSWLRILIELLAYGVAIVLLLNVSYAGDRQFSLSYSNIIILVLANMAIFGSLSYLFTRNNKWWRIGILPFVMAIFLGSATDNSWQKEVMNFSPLPWMYQFYYLKYLFIVIPGTIAGEYLKEWISQRSEFDRTYSLKHRHTPFAFLVSVAIVVMNLYGLYTRSLVFNLFVTIVLLAALWYLLKMSGNDAVCWRRLFIAGAYLLMLGLFFESYEGGIRKDYSTYSYYFVTSGLAFITILAFTVICDVYHCEKLIKPLEMAGKNPMIAYVAPNLVVMPLINLLGLSGYLALLDGNAWLGFLRGVVVTSLSVMLAMLFTKLKWFWRT